METVWFAHRSAKLEKTKYQYQLISGSSHNYRDIFNFIFLTECDVKNHVCKDIFFILSGHLERALVQRF